MKEIARFDSNGDSAPGNGEWCKWSDVEALRKELEDLRAQALAAVWLIPEDHNIAGLLHLAREARDVFMGKDKQTIAKLQDELSDLHVAYRQAVRPPTVGVNHIHGVKPGGPEYKDMCYELTITHITRAPNGGLDIEVRLP